MRDIRIRLRAVPDGTRSTTRYPKLVRAFIRRERAGKGRRGTRTSRRRLKVERINFRVTKIESRQWKNFRDRWMARKNGILTQINDSWLKAAPKEAKRDVGQIAIIEDQKSDVAADTSSETAALYISKLRESAVHELYLKLRRHHPPRHPPPHRRRAPDHQDDERNRRSLPQSRILRRRRPGD